MTLGQNITRLRTAKGMSQGALAEALGVSRQSVSKWETDGSIPELEKLINMAKLFEVSIDELVTGEPFTPPEAPP
ncbi:MAG: helix-turn-helix transcriptional regulator, partial [Oscillibacter sp.]|nr:helix-turn-helix transcriptional regulator [Oscillibacter sp.]